MATLVTLRKFKYNPDTTAKVVDYVNKKQPPRVVTQTPSPGTPVLEGMTIEVHAVSDSDVPFGVLDTNVPVLVKNVPVADMVEIVESDPDIQKAVAAGGITDPVVVEKFNRGIGQHGVQGALSRDEVDNLVKSLKGLGFGD
jgi:hypothetical protein